MVLRLLPPVVVFNGHALDIANAYILLQSIPCSAEINTLWVIFYANYPHGNTDRKKGQCVEAVTMYIHIYIHVCSKWIYAQRPKTILSFSLGEKAVESFTNHKHRPLGIASMFKEYKLVNINLLQISIAHGPGDASHGDTCWIVILNVLWAHHLIGLW